jgi:transposase
VLVLACELPESSGSPATRRSLDDLARQLVNDYAAEAMSRSTIARVLRAAAVQPHRCRYWLNSHDPDFLDRARAIGRLYARASDQHARGRLLLSTDEKTGMQVLQRLHPTRPCRPGAPERREYEYVRHGTRALLASLAVATGEVVWDVGPTRTALDFANHLLHTADHFWGCRGITWVVDNLNTHASAEVCEVLALLNRRPSRPARWRTLAQRRAYASAPGRRFRLEYLPRHGSWLNQIELFFSALARRFLRRGDFASADQFAERLGRFLEAYNAAEAHPYRWSFAGAARVRGLAFRRRREQEQHGRAWCHRRPACWSRALYPPRPYRRATG